MRDAIIAVYFILKQNKADKSTKARHPNDSSSKIAWILFLVLQSPHSRNTVALWWSDAAITAEYGLRKSKDLVSSFLIAEKTLQRSLLSLPV